ncbi:MAG: hypothetical protein IKM97_00380 [Clostridia bacterium]|nr:hypothetical protein [Clostridia bacterium]
MVETEPRNAVEKSLEIQKKLNIKVKIKKYILCLLIGVFLEVFLFNYPAIRTLIIGNRNIDVDYTVENDVITIKNLDTRVTSIRINYSNELTDKITYFVKFIAEDNSAYINLREKILLENDKQYINFDTHSKAKEIVITVLTESEVNIENIIINHCNFRINFYSLFIHMVVITFIYSAIDKSLYKERYETHEEYHNEIFIINLIVFSIIIIIYVFNNFGNEISLKNFLGKNDVKNSIYVSPGKIDKQDCILMQAEAIVHKQIKLMEKPSEELLKMENPYDSYKRNKDDISYLYDTAFYNGSYYNYFGIAPIILLVVPFRLITGKYLCTHIFNIVSIIGIIFSLYSLYKKLIKKYVKQISLCNFYLGYFAILFASNFLTLLRGAKYDIVVSFGIMFLLISLNLAISIYDNLKFRYLKLFLLGVCTGLIVLSKPNFIVYYPLILFLVISSMKEIKIKNKIKDSIIICMPLGILAISQMILNYVRFDNIFEFGARYQLTDFNMNTCMSITFGKIIQGIGEYIFKIPNVKIFTFPFVFINTEILATSLNELCYENRLVGLLGVPVFWIYIFMKDIISKSKNKELNRLIIISLIVSFLSIIINTCFAGICELYSLDFKMILSVIAIILFNKEVEFAKDNFFINKLFLVAMIATILIMIPISFTTEENFLINNKSSQTVFLKNFFEFWN